MTFREAFDRLKVAKCPEDVFGTVDPPGEFMALAVSIENGVKEGASRLLVDAAVILLDKWVTEMDKKLATLSYGERPVPDLNVPAETKAFAA